MPTKYYSHIKRKFLFAGAGFLLVLAGLLYWHGVSEFRLAELICVTRKDALEVWYATVCLEFVIGGLLTLLVAVLFFLFLRQIRKFEHAKLELLAQQDELQLKAKLLDSALDAILLLDESGKLLQFNNALCKLTGRSRRELETMSIQDFMPPGKADQVERRIRHILTSGHAVFESEYLHISGTVVPIEGHAQSVEIGHRQLVLSVVRDISERKVFEESLKSVVSEWRDTFDSVGDSIWLLDMNHRIIRANKATFEIFGKSPKEVVGLSCCEAAHKQFTPNHICPFEQMTRLWPLTR